MRKRHRLVPAFGLGALPALLVGVPAASLFLDAPPPGHTGGFGEPTCAACHFDLPADSLAGLTVEGLPRRYAPGEGYRLVITLRHPELRRGGFQIAAREAGSGAQAGVLEPLDRRTGVTARGAIQFAHHTAVGTEPVEGGVARWELRWTAPGGPAVPVVFHLAANVADADGSQFGDRIYTDSAHVRPAGRPRESS